MEPNKMMIPLFYGGMFNREGRRMRAAFVREVSDGTQAYRLWRNAGKQDLQYPRAENDKYILYVEINGYLATLGMTDYALADHCGFAPAAQKSCSISIISVIAPISIINGHINTSIMYIKRVYNTLFQY